MFLELAQHAAQGYESVLQSNSIATYTIVAGLSGILMYSAWRVYTFTIAPALRPYTPTILPYWIPVIGKSQRFDYDNSKTLWPGHALGFFTDFDGTLTRGRQVFTDWQCTIDDVSLYRNQRLTCNREYFGHTNEPYMISLPGYSLCIITSPEHLIPVFRNTVELTFDTFIRDVLSAIGASPGALDKWIPPRVASDKDGKAPFDTSSSLPSDFTHVGEKLCQRQLLPGEELTVIQNVFMANINELLLWDSIPTNLYCSLSAELESVSLLDWCRNVLMKSATRAFFGNHLLAIDPHLIDSFLIFDDASWKLHFGYPGFLSRDLHGAKNRMIEAMTEYFRSAKEKRTDASFLIKSFEVEMKAMDIDEKDIAALVMPVYWVINANAFKLCFWMMTYILSDPIVMSRVRKETDTVISEGTENLEYRLEERCPRLKAVYLETLRLTASSTTVRGVQSTTVIGEKVLRRGTNIFIPYRLLHLNTDTFGNNADVFDAERFLKAEELSKHPCFRPFGGGKTYCPGRYLAQREIYTFVALALHRFDISIEATKHNGVIQARASCSTLPRMDKKKFSLGIMDPAKGDDLMISVSKRGVKGPSTG